MPRTIVLFPFRFRDERTGKCIRARYLAERCELEQRYREWEIIGPAENRTVPDDPFSLQASHVARRGTNCD